MRVLLLMRGAPGCGKSTWIKNLRAVMLPEEIPKDICSLRDMYYSSFLKEAGQ